MKGLWILASRRRLAKLPLFFTQPPSTPGAILVQREELAELGEQYAALALPWALLPTTADGFGDKHREVWPIVKDLDWVGIACDDLRPQTPEWDKRLLSHVNGRNIITCNDGQQGNARMAGITIFSGNVIRAMGYLFPPNFWHSYVDNVWEDIGRATGCWTYVEDVLVTHDHPFTDQKLDPAKADDTTYKSYGKSMEDQAAYQHWRVNEYNAVCERVRKACQA